MHSRGQTAGGLHYLQVAHESAFLQVLFQLRQSAKCRWPGVGLDRRGVGAGQLAQRRTDLTRNEARDLRPPETFELLAHDLKGAPFMVVAEEGPQVDDDDRIDAVLDEGG